jgi:AraC-like DNA-binding protein
VVSLAAPSAALAPRIDLLWSLPRSAGRAGTAFRELLPASGMSLILRLSPSGSRVVLLGPAAEKASVEVDPGAEYLGVHFRTGQAPRLADVSPAELTNAHVDVARLGGERAETVAERLQALPDLPARQRLLEELLRPLPPLARDARCREAALLLERRGGLLRVDDLAARLGLHVRSLERRFLEHLGLPPKRLARLVRLRHVLARLHAGGYGTLADLAHACGYADQAHLARDFRDLTGRPPGERDAFRSRPLPGSPETRVVHRYRQGDAVSRSFKPAPGEAR